MKKSNLKKISLYKQPAQIYDAMMSTDLETFIFKTVVKEIIKKLSHNKETTILDLCCGTGIIANMLRGQKRIKFTGVDINKNFLSLAKRKLKKNKNFHFVLKNALRYNTAKKFDIILLTSAYHHVENRYKSKLLKKIYGFLKKEGILIIYEKTIPPYSNKKKFQNSNKEFYLKRIEYLKKTEKRKLSDKQFQALMNVCNLSAIAEEEYKVDYKYIIKDLNRNHFRIIKELKIWPKKDIFSNKKIGDFVFVVKKFSPDRDGSVRPLN